MDFWATVLVLFRRWYITVPAFFGALGLAGAAYSVVPVEYQSGSVLVLTTPLSGGTESEHAAYPPSLTNPLMNFDRSLALSASIVIQQLNSSTTASTLGIAPGGTTSYLVNNGSTNPELLESGPFIFVQGTAPSPEAAQQITEQVAAMAADVLAQRQDELNAPPSTRIGLEVVVPATAGQPLTGNGLRGAAAVGALASLASLAAVYGFESLMTHRRRRQAEKARAAGLDGTVSRTRDARAPGRFRSRSTHPDAGRQAPVREVAPAATHRVNGVPASATPRAAVGLLEGTGDDERADRPPDHETTEER